VSHTLLMIINKKVPHTDWLIFINMVCDTVSFRLASLALAC